ncbi:MAG: RraA family protein [Candidatus Hodarchaeales archaeon]|jgi:regulator of RNase E activity RraA
MTIISDNDIIEELKKIDTPTISNVVASYPKSDNCLKLYDAWYGQWYTDTTIKCIYPEMGSIVGYVATVIFCEESEKFTGVNRWALPNHIIKTKKPVVLVAEQQFSPEIANRVGLFGEMMTTQYKALGVVGVVTNGPMRDIDAIKPLGVQYYSTGTTPAHGDMMIKEVGEPVMVGGMKVRPGDMVHMDLHGVVKFPPEKMREILNRANKLLEMEVEQAAIFNDPNFSIEEWKSKLADTK